MHLQIVEFELRGVARSEYERRCEQVAPAFAQIPGLVAKQWIVDPETNRAGGVYTWTDRAACDAYVDGELFAAVQADPAFANLRSRRFDVLDAPTAVTAPGRAAAIAA